MLVFVHKTFRLAKDVINDMDYFRGELKKGKTLKDRLKVLERLKSKIFEVTQITMSELTKCARPYFNIDSLIVGSLVMHIG